MAVHKKYDRNVLGRGLDNIGDGKGRGLDALINTKDVETEGSSNLSEIPIEKIMSNPNQPRREFDEEALEELANSIREIGIITPITLRQTADGNYQIIAGERRWRAAKAAGLKAIPAYIRTVEDEGVMEVALVENIQRIGMTQERISERVGKSRTSVTNFMRLLKLPAQIQMALKNHEIDMGHARALLAIDSPSAQIKLFKDIQKNNYSVRKVEELVKMIKDGSDLSTAKKTAEQKARLPEEFNALRKRLTDLFQTKIQMTYNPKGKGKITIGFDNPDELEHIMNTFDKISN